MLEKKLELTQYRRMMARAQGALDAGDGELAARYFDCAGILHDALIQKLQGLNNAQIREVMTLRYLRGMEWAEITERMNFSQRWVMKLHKRGLELL